MTSTDASVLDALLAVNAVTRPQKFCVAGKNLAAAAAVKCIAGAGVRRLVPRSDPRGVHTSEYAHCFNQMYDAFAARDERGACLTAGDGVAIGELVNPVGGYLPGAIFPDALLMRDSVSLYAAILHGADLRGARLVTELRNGDFSGADLSGATLAGAEAENVFFDATNFTGATLLGLDCRRASFVGAVWSNTTCPDGSNSATNGSSPESCCGHLVSALTVCTP